MDFGYQKENILNLLGRNKNVLEIPRYQRGYSWNEENLKTFLKDIISGIKYTENELCPTEYFFGTFLLKGNYDSTAGNLEVIDGQQRITTTVILLAALHNILIKISDSPTTLETNEHRNEVGGTNPYRKLADDILNGDLLTNERRTENKKKTLKIDTGSSFYERYLFEKNNRELLEPRSEIEFNIKKSYDFFNSSLAPEAVANTFKQYSTLIPDNLLIIDYYYGIYDQLRSSVVVILSTTNEKEATSIFESLNSKGLSLSESDKIKNKIFNLLDEKEPLDRAKTKWSDMADELSLHNDTKWISIGEFIQVYWKSNISSVSERNIYKDFIERQSASSQYDLMSNLENLLDEFVSYSKSLKILRGEGRYRIFASEYREEISVYITNIIYVQKIRQSEPLLLQIIRSFELNNINAKDIKTNLHFLADFHNIYNTFLQKPPNKLRSPYLNAAVKIGEINRSTRSTLSKKSEIRNILKELRGKFKSFLPEEQHINQAIIDFDFSKVSYSNKVSDKSQNSKNQRASYICRSYHIHFHRKLHPGMNFEHILSDSPSEDHSHYPGNLLLLEIGKNDRCKDKTISEKVPIYRESENRIYKKLEDSGWFLELESDPESTVNSRSVDIIKFIYDKMKRL